MRRTLSLLACIAGVASSHAAEQKPGYALTLVDMQGHKQVLGTVPDSVVAPRVSPDGHKVSFEQTDPPEAVGAPSLTRIYVGEMDQLDKRHGLQVTVIATKNVAPVWSPNGEKIVFTATGNGWDSLYWERADGGIQPIYLADGKAAECMYANDRLTFLTLTGDKDYGIALLDTDTGKVTRLIDQKGSAQHSSSVSPDGHWIAYASDETGRDEVWLEPLPTTGKRTQLTKGGGNFPEWSPDGKQLYFDQSGQLFRLDVATAADGPRAGSPVALPIKGFQQSAMWRQYDLTPDGKGFVMLYPVAAAGG